jgi:hypothetical protein
MYPNLLDLESLPYPQSQAHPPVTACEILALFSTPKFVNQQQS